MAPLAIVMVRGGKNRATAIVERGWVVIKIHVVLPLSDK